MLIKGVEFSEETIVNALENAGIKVEKPKTYQFKAGDVVETSGGSKRLIVHDSEGSIGIRAVAAETDCFILSTIKCQGDCESFGYKKIGRLKDFIK